MSNIDTSNRRGDYDVANTVQVTNAHQVRDHVCQLFRETYGDTESLTWLISAFNDFISLYSGSYEGYEGCDTLYHDMQHTLDVTLAMARLLNGYERHHPRKRLGKNRFVLGVIVALFHDAGYIRTSGDNYADNGAVYTLTHVSRSAQFLRRYLPTIGLTRYADLSTTLVHYTGYELDLNDLVTTGEKDRQLGALLGTADLIAQMSDRCYLEKCRDRLYPEFVLCGMAGTHSQRHGILFKSANDLLEKTPDFYHHSVVTRLSANFSRAYRYASVFFEGVNPYMDYIAKNIQHLEHMNESGDYNQLNRILPETRGIEQFPFQQVG